MTLPDTDGLALCPHVRPRPYDVSLSLGRCLGYTVRRLEDRVPPIVKDHSNFSLCVCKKREKKLEKDHIP